MRDILKNQAKKKKRVKDSFKVQNRPIDFNVVDYESFLRMVFNSTF